MSIIILISSQMRSFAQCETGLTGELHLAELSSPPVLCHSRVFRGQQSHCKAYRIPKSPVFQATQGTSSHVHDATQPHNPTNDIRPIQPLKRETPQSSPQHLHLSCSSPGRHSPSHRTTVPAGLSSPRAVTWSAAAACWATLSEG